MIPQEYCDLMNEEIDGTIAPEDAPRLAAYLAGNPEAAQFYRELQESVATLARQSRLVPPAGLRERILAAVAAVRHQAAPPAGRRSWLRARLGYGYAFAAGLALGFVVLAAVRPMSPSGGSNAHDIVGAILGDVASGQGAEVVPLEMNVAGVTAAVRTYTVADHILVRLNLATDRPVDIRFEYDEHMPCEEFRSSGRCDLSVSGQQVALDRAVGGDYDFVLEHADRIVPSIRVQLIEHRAVLYEGTIDMSTSR